MAYKMDPTKKKNKNGAINKIFKGIAKAGLSIAFGPLGIGGKLGKEAFQNVKNQTPQLPSIQVSNGNKKNIWLWKNCSNKCKKLKIIKLKLMIKLLIIY